MGLSVINNLDLNRISGSKKDLTKIFVFFIKLNMRFFAIVCVIVMGIDIIFIL